MVLGATPQDRALTLNNLHEAQEKTDKAFFAVTVWELGDFIPKKPLVLSKIMIPRQELRTRVDFYNLLSWHRKRVTIE